MASGQRPPDPALLDAVTIDGYGTLIVLRDPVGALTRLLPGFTRAAIEQAFRVEAAHYEASSYRGRDPASVERLQDECVAVFNRELGSSLTAAEYVGAFAYEWVAGARESVAALRARGLALAVVADWDVSLAPLLDPLRVPVITSAHAAVAKPHPAPFRLALERLAVEPARALHVGDRDKDRAGAAAAGMHFSWAPLAGVVEAWR